MAIKLPAIKGAKLGRVGRAVRKASPTIMVLGGTAGVITATIMAVKASNRANKAISDLKSEIDKVEEVKAEHEEYTDADKRRDLRQLYFSTAWKLVRIYGPSALVGAASVSAILGGHHIMLKRNAVLTAGLASVQKAFDTYRSRVISEEGRDKDKYYRSGIREQEADVVDIKEDGSAESHKVKQIDIPSDQSEYGRWFMKGTSVEWKGDPSYDLSFLKGKEAYFNNLLHSREEQTVFFNEVLYELGLPKVPEGQIVGWSLKNPNCDGYIDFGIRDNWYLDSDAYNVCHGGKPLAPGEAIWLNFNVDGAVVQYM